MLKFDRSIVNKKKVCTPITSIYYDNHIFQTFFAKYILGCTFIFNCIDLFCTEVMNFSQFKERCRVQKYL